MHAACLVAEFVSMEKVHVALEVLRLDHFASDAVSVAWRGHEDAIKQVEDHEQRDENPGEAAHDIRADALIDETLRGAVATYLAISNAKIPVMVAGPLTELIRDAIADNLIDEAKHWGIHEHAAMRFIQRLADNAILVIVTSTPYRLDEAKAVLKTCGPESLERFEGQPPT
jgi:hypothetical protein